jgi:hypothetical protein
VAILKKRQMRVFNAMILTLVTCSCVCGQEKKLFDIRETINKDSIQTKKITDFAINDSVFFQDDNYLVRKSCSGEWGGSVWFKNKRTGIEYSCNSTCPVVINKFRDKYIVTNTLAHLIGFSEIIEIENPDSMTIFKLPEPRAKKRKMIYRYVGDNESKSTIGTKKLLDSIGVLTLASFPYNGQLYHIVTDFRKTFLTEIENKKFVSIDTISNESLWTYDPEVIRTKANHYVIYFSNDKVNGYIDLIDNKIDVIRFK